MKPHCTPTYWIAIADTPRARRPELFGACQCGWAPYGAEGSAPYAIA